MVRARRLTLPRGRERIYTSKFSKVNTLRKRDVRGQCQKETCGDLEGWDRAREREAQEGRDMCLLMADSYCCRAKTNTYCTEIIFQFKITLKIVFCGIERNGKASWS